MEKLESDYNMIDWWKKVVFKNYANFSGRARRAEYWYFALGNFLLIIPFYIVGIIGISTESSLLSILGFGVYGIVALGALIPSLAVSVRRMHDTNKTGWLYLLVIIPLIGPIIILIWFFTDGDRFTNNYGPDPKNPAADFDFEKQPGAFQ